MDVSPLVWTLTILGILGLLAFDYFFHVRRAHVPQLREAAIWSSVYVGLALLFGVGTLIFGGGAMGSEYFAGYVTEKALSVDNLFVFLIIMTSFRVPREDQQKVLLFGIMFSLVARTGFILLGSALINTFAWVFYLFGLVLLITAGNMLRPQTEEAHSAQNVVVRLSRRLFRTTDNYDGDKLFTVQNGRRVMTPMLLVMVAIAGTDLMFALDSIPAIFGLTQNVFVVFTATAFSLLGLRQLYFLLDGLLDRLIYLSFGLAAILGFIGVKLVLHALHENNVPFINDGEHVEVAEISTGLSLTVILAVLVVTVLASLLSTRGRTQTAMANARRDAIAYLDSEYTSDPVERERIYRRLIESRDHIVKLGPKAKQIVKNEPELLELCGRAALSHDAALASGRHPDDSVLGPDPTPLQGPRRQG
ncbi:Integral membrane protein TerC [Kribbella flavida DSM 17836]|uniref:Integral membrane protein TerC n=1 Tax=Kribbella flavida (strain DSM 17836 / JCM 10339 / NBRC 14399) TaxID=479435 RepID=D2PUE3_KRIFD|nr:TerC family protein [Kribbella flavida]ADB35194.1 Integral membrane protein TerC [Kribbella flavida DSM 17836]